VFEIALVATAPAPPPQPLATPAPRELLATDPATRGTVSFLVTLAAGGAVVYARGDRLRRAVAASEAAPLRSTVYGLLAFAIGSVLLLYGGSQLGRLVAGVGAGALATAAVLAVLATFVATFGGAGFAVVGLWATGVVGSRDPFVGLVGVGAAGAVAWAVLPVAAAAAVWLLVSAAGVGGATRLWFHDSRDVVDPRGGPGPGS
jgi:hypothetical protein